MNFHFMWTVQCCQHGEVEKTAGLALQSRTGPDFTPAPFRNKLLQRSGQVIGVGKEGAT